MSIISNGNMYSKIIYVKDLTLEGMIISSPMIETYIPIKSRNISSSTEPLELEVKRLRRELKIAKEERDILYPKGRLRAKRQPHTLQKTSVPLEGKLYKVCLDI